MSATNANDALEKGLLAISLPLFLEILLTYLINFTDVLFLNYVSEASAAAVGTLMPVIVIPIVILHSLSIGTTAVLGRMLGAGETEGLPRNYRHTVVFNTGVGVAVMLVYWLCYQHIGRWMGLDAEMAQLTSAYLFMFLPALLIKSVQIGYSSILNVNGWTKLNLWATLTANSCNIVLNSLFISGWINTGLSGVENVAVASTLSFLVGLLVAMYFVHGYKKIGFQPGGEACVKQQYSFTAFMRQTLKIGVPATMEPMSYELNRFFITIVVIGLGTLAVSTRIYSLNLILVPVIFSQAIGVGNRILVSYLLGKGDAAAIEAQIKESIKVSVLGSSAMLLLIWFFSDYAFGIFTDADDILALGAVLIGIDMLRHPAGATNMVLVNSLVVAGDARYPVAISIASMWLICLPLVYVFGVVLEYGLYGVWIALLLDEYFRCIMNLGRWSARRWQRMSMLPTS